MAEERKYRIRVDGILVDVSKEVYHAYYSIERHTRTLDEKDTRNGKVLYSDLDTDELLGEEMLPDRNAERVEDSAICSILCEELHYQLAMLPAQIYNETKNSVFKDSTLEKAIINKKLSCAQCLKLMSLYTFDNDKLKMLQVLKDHIADTTNYDNIVNSLDFISSKNKAKEILGIP